MDARADAGALVARLLARFNWIGATRMRDLPVYHHGLEVEAVDFQAHDAGWLGVLITPWFMNVMLFPREDDNWSTLALGDRVSEQLPGGAQVCMVGEDEELGLYKFITLASPVFCYKTQQAARAAAQAALVRLLTPPSDNPDMTAPAAPVRFVSREPSARPDSGRRDFLRRVIRPLSERRDG